MANTFGAKCNLYLIGFMGTGKSAVGKSIAERLKYRFIDVDHSIEAAEKRSIPDIFASDGEGYFRGLEKEFIQNGHPKDGCVISCGGGLPIADGMMDLLVASGYVVCLCATEDTIYNRVRLSTNRPLLKVEDPREKIRTLLSERGPVYRKANASIITDGRNIGEVVSHVLRAYNGFVKKFK